MAEKVFENIQLNHEILSEISLKSNLILTRNDEKWCFPKFGSLSKKLRTAYVKNKQASSVLVKLEISQQIEPYLIDILIAFLNGEMCVVKNEVEFFRTALIFGISMNIFI